MNVATILLFITDGKRKTGEFFRMTRILVFHKHMLPVRVHLCFSIPDMIKW